MGPASSKIKRSRENRRRRAAAVQPTTGGRSTTESTPEPSTPPASTISASTLWARALDKLRNRGILCPDPGNAGGIQLVQQLIAEAKSKREECDDKRLFYKNNSGEKVFYADKFLKQLNRYAAIGDIAIQHHPDVVALAWSGFRLLLQVGTAYVENMELVSDSLEYLMSVIFCGEIYERLYSGTVLTAASHLDTYLVDLYASILEYLNYAIQYLQKNTAARIVESFSSEMKRLIGVVQVLERATKDKADMAEKEAAENGRFEQGARVDELKKLLVGLQKSMLPMQHAVIESYRKIGKIWQYVTEKKREEVLRWVSDVEYGSHHLEFQSRRHPDTGNWLLEDKNIYDWENTSSTRTFWLRGDPGSGKTLLASKMVDKLRERKTSQDTVAYFYCYFQEKARRCPGSILRAIVKQLCIAYSREGLPESVMAAYELRQKEGHSTGPLHPIESKKLIIKLSRQFSQTIILIDALDECDQETRGELFRVLKEIVAEPTLKLFVTSRIEGDIRDFLCQVPSYYINAKDNSGDISKYINTEIELLCNEKPRLKDNLELKNEIISTLEVGARGMFMWVHLQIQAIRRAYTANDIRMILQDLPRTLNDTYANILERIGRDDDIAGERAYTTLRWVFFAQGVCSPEVVGQALIIEPMKPNQDIDPDSLLEPSEIVDSCRNLLVHDTELNVLRFAHFTVKEFLLQSQEFSPNQAHTKIAEVCLTVLSNGSNFKTRTCPIPELLQYCVFNWAAHTQQSGAGSATLKQLWLNFLEPSSDCYRNWVSKVASNRRHFRLKGSNQKEVIHPVWTACYYQLYDIFQFLLGKFDNPDCCNGWGESPLIHAAEHGYEKFVKLLLQRDGVDVNRRSNWGHTPLSQATMNSHEKIVEILLRKDGVDVNGKDNAGYTPLSRAVSNGHRRIVELVLQKDTVDVNSRDEDGCTPLSRATMNDHEKIVELLLQKDGVDMNGKDNAGYTPLSRAVSNGHRRIVELVLQKDTVDVNSRDEDGCTPLSRATMNSRRGIVELLLQKDGVDVNSKDKQGSAPLSLAALNGHPAVVEILLQNDGVDVNSKDKHDNTPLSLAALNGHRAVVEILLQKDGVDVDSKNSKGNTPLSRATFEGHRKIVELLLQRDGIDVNNKDHGGDTPLSQAASKGHKKIVGLLLQKDGVDTNSKNNKGNTPLSRAVLNGQNKIVELLLQKDEVDVNSKDNEGYTPLSRAALWGREGIVKLFLQMDKVDVNSKGNDGRSPLSWAACFGYEKVVQLLLQKDSIEINCEDEEGLTPRELAAKNGHDHIVELLSM